MNEVFPYGFLCSEKQYFTIKKGPPKQGQLCFDDGKIFQAVVLKRSAFDKRFDFQENTSKMVNIQCLKVNESKIEVALHVSFA